MKWEYYKGNDELRGWDPYSVKPVVVVITSGDIEILIDEDGRIQEIVIGNVSKKIDLGEIESIAEIIDEKLVIEKPKTKTK